MIDRMLLFWAYTAGCSLCLLATALMRYAPVPDAAWVMIVLSTFATGFAGMSLACEIFEASMNAVIMVFAEQPESLSQAHPIVYHRLSRIAEMRHYMHGQDDL